MSKKKIQYGKRYSPSQERAIERLELSKEIFEFDVALEDRQELLARNAQKGGYDAKESMISTKPDENEHDASFDAFSDKKEIMTRRGRRKRLSPSTRLFHCIVDGKVREARALVAKEGLDIRMHNDSDGGLTPLHYAARYGYFDVAKWIISLVRRRSGEEGVRNVVRCSDSARRRYTPLMEACRGNSGDVSNRCKIVELLLQNGADLSHQDAAGDTALHLAARKGNFLLIRRLENLNSARFRDALRKKNDKGRVALQVFSGKSRADSAAVEALLGHGGFVR